MNDYCGGTGDLRFTLTWDRPGDIDLRVVTPNNREIYYGARNFDGGTLDRDDRTGTGPENVFWSSAPPPGTYVVCVDPYRTAGPTNFSLTVSSSGFPPRVFSGQRSGTSRGSCNRGSPNFVAEIVVGASGGCPANSYFSQATGYCECNPGMQWNGQACVAPPPPSCPYACAAGQVCVNGACVGNGDLRFTLTWDRPGDMDLHVITPNNREIYFAARNFDGGTLDRDDRTGTGPENVFWANSAQPGTYVVCANPYGISSPTSFTLTIAQGGQVVRSVPGMRTGYERGSCARGSANYVTEFTVGAGFPGGGFPGGGFPGGGNPGGGATPYQWMPASGAYLPPGAVQGGTEANGQPLFICRAPYQGGNHLGKVVAGRCNIGYAGAEVGVAQFEVLVGPAGRWVGASNGYVPPGAMVGGNESNGQPLYICRAGYRGGTHVGKVVGNSCNFGFGGAEIAVPQYEVLLP